MGTLAYRHVAAPAVWLLALLCCRPARAQTPPPSEACRERSPWCDQDEDGDGVPDHLDACPDQPEDLDENEDLDGCPDPDDDADGIPDTDDSCPDFREDRDGIADRDGCPEAPRPGRAWSRGNQARRAARAQRPAPEDWIDVALDVSNSHRHLTVANPSAVADRAYDTPGTGYLEAGLEVRVLWPSWPHLGLTVALHRSIGLSSGGCTTTAASCDHVDIGSDQHELLVAATGRVRFGRTARSVSLLGLLGYGQYVFALDPADTLALPASARIETHEYHYAALEARVEIPAAPPHLRFELAAFVRAGLGSLGDTALATYGASPESGYPRGWGGRIAMLWGIPFPFRGAYVGARVEYCDFYAELADQTIFALMPSDDEIFRLALLLGWSARAPSGHRAR